MNDYLTTSGQSTSNGNNNAGKKKLTFKKFINAYGKIEVTVFAILFVLIIALAIRHNFF